MVGVCICVLVNSQTMNVCLVCECRRLSLQLHPSSSNKHASQTASVWDCNRASVVLFAEAENDLMYFFFFFSVFPLFFSLYRHGIYNISGSIVSNSQIHASDICSRDRVWLCAAQTGIYTVPFWSHWPFKVRCAILCLMLILSSNGIAYAKLLFSLWPVISPPRHEPR